MISTAVRHHAALHPALSAAAAASYAANCALGVAVATRAIDTSNARWVHHALYTGTVVLTASAVVLGLATGNGRRAAALAPALVPLALIPFAGTHSRRHPLVSLAAAPFYVAALITNRR